MTLEGNAPAGVALFKLKFFTVSYPKNGHLGFIHRCATEALRQYVLFAGQEL